MENQANWTKKLKLGLIIVAVLALLIVAFFGGRTYQKRIPSEAEQYLQQQVVELKQEISNWEKQAKDLEAYSATLQLQVESLEKQLQNVKKEYNKKISSIKSYSNPELERFFAERYSN